MVLQHTPMEWPEAGLFHLPAPGSSHAKKWTMFLVLMAALLIGGYFLYNYEQKRDEEENA